MPWLRIDDKFPRHPKVTQLTDREFRVHVRVLCYCAEYRTAGLVTTGMLAEVPGLTKKVIDRFINLGVWDEDGSGYRVHDFEHYNPKDPSAAERQQRVRDKKRDADRDVGRDADRDAAVTVTSPHAQAGARGPYPYPSGSSSSPSSSTPDDDDTNITDRLEQLALPNQIATWRAAYTADPARVAACLRVAQQRGGNIGAYLNTLIRSGEWPTEQNGAGTEQTVKHRDPHRVFTAVKQWIGSPGFDPSADDDQAVLEEIERRERKHDAQLNDLQREELLDQARERRQDQAA